MRTLREPAVLAGATDERTIVSTLVGPIAPVGPPPARRLIATLTLGALALGSLPPVAQAILGQRFADDAVGAATRKAPARAAHRTLSQQPREQRISFDYLLSFSIWRLDP